jgi:hypothetical protein
VASAPQPLCASMQEGANVTASVEDQADGEFAFAVGFPRLRRVALDVTSDDSIAVEAPAPTVHAVPGHPSSRSGVGGSRDTEAGANSSSQAGEDCCLHELGACRGPAPALPGRTTLEAMPRLVRMHFAQAGIRGREEAGDSGRGYPVASRPRVGRTPASATRRRLSPRAGLSGRHTASNCRGRPVRRR